MIEKKNNNNDQSISLKKVKLNEINLYINIKKKIRSYIIIYFVYFFFSLTLNTRGEGTDSLLSCAMTCLVFL